MLVPLWRRWRWWRRGGGSRRAAPSWPSPTATRATRSCCSTTVRFLQFQPRSEPLAVGTWVHHHQRDRCQTSLPDLHLRAAMLHVFSHSTPGFVEEGNPHDVLMVACPLPPVEQWGGDMHARAALLAARGLTPQLFLPAPQPGDRCAHPTGVLWKTWQPCSWCRRPSGHGCMDVYLPQVACSEQLPHQTSAAADVVCLADHLWL
jgi:hypothetical protein